MRVLIVEDHPLTADALRRLLEEMFRGVQVLRAATPDEAIQVARAQMPLDLCIADLVFARGPAVEFIREFCRAFVRVPVAVYSGVTDPAMVQAVLRAGALGFVPKRKDPHVFKSAIRSVLSGEGYAPVELVGPGVGPRPEGAGGLSDRELDVLRLMASTGSRKTVARTLDISTNTVKSHLANVYRRLGVTNAEDAIRRVNGARS